MKRHIKKLEIETRIEKESGLKICSNEFFEKLEVGEEHKSFRKDIENRCLINLLDFNFKINSPGTYYKIAEVEAKDSIICRKRNLK